MLWLSTYVLLAVMFMILRLEILMAALHPALPLKIFRTTGSALFAEWERICLKRKNEGKTESAVKMKCCRLFFIVIDIVIIKINVKIKIR